MCCILFFLLKRKILFTFHDLHIIHLQILQGRKFPPSASYMVLYTINIETKHHIYVDRCSCQQKALKLLMLIKCKSITTTNLLKESLKKVNYEKEEIVKMVLCKQMPSGGIPFFPVSHSPRSLKELSTGT